MDKMVLWGPISVDKTKLEQIITLPNFTFGQLCSNRLEFDLIKL